ncbi:MAG: sigma-70 family RNA polymerase sigma factor [Peptostreptococcaceae bacterium]
MRINEKNFIKYLKKKDEIALDYIINTYGGLVKSVIHKHLYNLEEYKEECMQDVFLAVWYGVDKYCEMKGDFKNWIAAIAKYKCIMYKRKYSTLSLNQDIEEADIKVDSIEMELKKKELKEEINTLLENLKPEDKQIFIEYYIEDKTIKEIASSMELRDDNVYNRISRGKKKLRNLFKIQ